MLVARNIRQALPCHSVIGCHSTQNTMVQSALDDVAYTIGQAIPPPGPQY
jgi:hypothetical protein